MLFLLSAVCSGTLFGIAGYSKSRKKLKKALLISLPWLAFVVAVEVAGCIMCWSNAMEKVKAAW